MKSVIKGVSEEKQGELVFPVLMESVTAKNGTLVVLFTGEENGMCIVSTNAQRKLGEWDDDWAYASDTSEWKKFTGTVELSN